MSSEYSRVPTEDPEEAGSDKKSASKSSKKKASTTEGDAPKKKSGAAKNGEVKRDSSSASNPGKRKSSVSNGDGGEDSNVKIQFAASQFFCSEDTNATVRVMRVGPIQEACKVKYHTEDGSAKAGIKYTETAGVLKFKEGELYKTFDIPIIASESFDTVLEFFVELDGGDGCTVCPHAGNCRVMVLDNDTFPSTKFKDVVDQQDEDALQEVGVPLLVAYMQLALWSVPGVWWKAFLTLFFDQMENVYDLGMVYLRVYLVDVVLNLAEDESQLLMPDRQKTAVLLAGLYFGPCVGLCIIERLKQGPWYMGAALGDSLKVNIFRKYLNYTDSSRRAAPLQDLTGAMSGDVADLVENGFLGMFEVVQYFGKILLTGYFVVSKNPINAVPLALYPLILVTFTWCRQSQATEVQDDVDDAGGNVLGTVLTTCQDFEIICDYGQRGAAVDTFEKQLLRLEKAEFRNRIFMFYNEQLVPMITNLIVAGYIVVGASQVLAGTTTVGSFIATVTIFQTLGTKFEKIYGRLRTWLTAVGPIVGVTTLLSLPATTEARWARSKEISKVQKGLIEEEQEKQPNMKNSEPLYNNLPIRLTEVGVAKISALKTMTIEAAQGSLIAVIGPHASGKSALMKTVARGADKGIVFLPEHLRSLNVSHDPIVFDSKDLLENICFGSRVLDEDASFENDEDAQNRLRKLCQRIGCDKKLMVRLDEDITKRTEASKKKRKSKKADVPVTEEEEEDGEEVDHDHWCVHLSLSEKARIHLVRAFVYDPEIMVLHKPLNGLDQAEVTSTIALLREHVDNRGLENDPSLLNMRTPRSLFVSVGNIDFSVDSLIQVSDELWRLPGSGKLVVSPGGRRDPQPDPPESTNLLDN